MAIHSKVSKALIRTGVRELKEFNLNGTMKGIRYSGTYAYSNNYRPEVEGATYVIFSYLQPVVWFKDGKWYVTSRKWSVTTTNHTSNANMAVYWETGDYAEAV